VPFGRQQLFSTEQADVLGLQSRPGSSQARPWSQRPNSWLGDDFEQWTSFVDVGTLFSAGEPDQPQQSLSARQISPRGPHPEGGWQTRKPGAAPLGAQIFEQHVPPHSGTVLLVVPQTVPFTEQLPTPGAVTVSPQVPSVPAPSWTQYEIPLEQKPPVHTFEQQSPPPPHGLPAVLHVLLSGVHFFPPPLSTHSPPQHCSFVVHAWVSAVHCATLHLPPTQEFVQHSVPATQLSFAALQVLGGPTQIMAPLTVAQFRTPLTPQHSSDVVHD
jgi:hypothetical protein